VFDEDKPEKAEVERLTALLSFLNVYERKNNENEHKNLKNK
jgi:hypothetical protein